MNAFQVIGVGLCGLFAMGILISAVRHRVGPWVGAAWLILWVGAGVAIARPELTVLVARALGIARGADLVFYSAILAMFIGFFAVYMKFRRIEGGITTLVRHIALLEAHGDAGARRNEPADRDDEPDPDAAG